MRHLPKEIFLKAGELYSKGKSLTETSNFLSEVYHFNIHPNTLGYHLKKEGINLRDCNEGQILRRRKHIDIPTIITHYQKTKSIRAVARDTGTCRTTVRKILVERGIPVLDNDAAIQSANTKYEKHAFSGSDEEKAYLYGFVVGDVHIFRKSKFTLRAITHTTHRSFVDLFSKEFEKYAHIRSRYIEKRKEWCLSADLDSTSFSFLETRTSNNIPTWIKENSFLDFLAGLLDSDGCIMTRRTGKYFQNVIRFFGENKELLNEIKNRLEQIGFKPSFYRNAKKGQTRILRNKILRYNADYYVLELSKKHEVARMLQLLPIKHFEKMTKRELALEICKSKHVWWVDIKERVLSVRSTLEAQQA